MKKIEVVAAVITNKDGKIFCAKRKDEGPLALKWEFPGGKIEENETHKEALRREIEEEFSTTITVDDFIMTVNHTYPHFHLTLHAYYAKVKNGDLVLNEHTDYEWLNKEDLMSLDWAEADIPVVKALMQ